MHYEMVVEWAGWSGRKIYGFQSGDLVRKAVHSRSLFSIRLKFSGQVILPAQVSSKFTLVTWDCCLASSCLQQLLFASDPGALGHDLYCLQWSTICFWVF